MSRQIEGPLTRADYSLDGPRATEARALGLAEGAWYKSPVPRATLKELMKRSDGPGIRDTIIWIACMVALAGAAVYFWPSWGALPLIGAYGVLYASGGEARWHECTHGTAFKTRWINDLVYQLACFCAMRDPTVSRWSHTRHHTDTYVIGLDPEITGFRPPDILRHAVAFFGLQEAPGALYLMARHALGILVDEEAMYVPQSERWKVAATARCWLLIYLVTIAACVYWWSILPALLIGLPRFYGVWFIQLVAQPQHMGLFDDVLDHRLNSRTIYMNPISRFIYWNMNYHVEHHMYPMVPFHKLAQLHEAIKADCPPAYPNVWAAYAEIIPTLRRQLREPGYRVLRPLPQRSEPTGVAEIAG